MPNRNVMILALKQNVFMLANREIGLHCAHNNNVPFMPWIPWYQLSDNEKSILCYVSNDLTVLSRVWPCLLVEHRDSVMLGPLNCQLFREGNGNHCIGSVGKLTVTLMARHTACLDENQRSISYTYTKAE